jgi:hypothetical protein
MPLAQQEANFAASAGVPIRKPVRPESMLSWRTWVPDDGQVDTPGGASRGAGDQGDPQP